MYVFFTDYVISFPCTVVEEENLANNAETLGSYFRSELRRINSPLIREVRGRGLLNAVEINAPEESEIAWNVCLKMADYGVLAKPTHGNIIRLAPPLVITKSQVDECLDAMRKAMQFVNK